MYIHSYIHHVLLSELGTCSLRINCSQFVSLCCCHCRLLKFCAEKGVYVGCEFSNPTLDTDDELEECMEDLGKLKLSGTPLHCVLLNVSISVTNCVYY